MEMGTVKLCKKNYCINMNDIRTYICIYIREIVKIEMPSSGMKKMLK